MQILTLYGPFSKEIWSDSNHDAYIPWEYTENNKKIITIILPVSLTPATKV